MPSPHPIVQLRSGRDKPLDWGHPWVFSGAVDKADREAKEGSLVTVLDSKGRERGVAFYGSKTIALKFLTREPEPINAEFFRKRFLDAFLLRKRLGLLADPQINSHRIFFAESDAIPGLIIDRYGKTAVMQLQEPGLQPFEEMLAAELVGASDGILEHVFLKSREDGGRYLCGSAQETVIVENGAKFPVDWERGQKTGFFLDQRENRALLRKYCPGNSVLNCFSYTGGFSINAVLGGAKRVVSVDSSEWALEMLGKASEMNSGADRSSPELNSVRSDCFDFLTELDEQFDVVIIDPPAFVKHRAATDQGLRGYQQINASAMKAVKPGGVLLTFSCSQLVAREQFRKVVFEAALSSKRRIRILSELHQAPCHPVQLFFPESEYLKGYLLFVD